MTVRLRVSADYTNAYFEIKDGNNWASYRTFTESTTEYIVVQIDATNNPTWIHEGTLLFRITSGSEKKSFNSKNEYLSYVEIFYAAIEEITPETTTFSNSSLSDTDNDGLSDWEEYHPGADGFVTNPRNSNTDSDGLIDSAESVSIMREYGKRECFTDQSHQFHFMAIIDGGNAKNATVFVGFTSTTDLKINLVKVEVAGKTVVEEINPTVEEPDSGLDGTYFFKGYDITTKTTIFSGEWRLTIDVIPIKSSEKFSVLLQEFKAEVVLPLNPTKADWDKDGLLDGVEMKASITGWITNPRAGDSDGDGLNDREEIYIYKTNPLSTDTDGDGATDRLDCDPLFNLIIKITVIKAHAVDATHTPLLSVVMKVGDKAIATLPVWASLEGHKVWWWWANRTSVFNWDYFFDVPDDIPIAHLGIELWWINPISWLCDTQLLSLGYDYTLGTGGDPKTTEQKLNNKDGNWVQFQVSTLGLKRVNTIAVYSEGNFFNGHYPTLERFVVIALGVNGNGAPFQEGVNIILIPVSLFMRTELHYKWENKDLPDALTDASASGIVAEFYGLDSSAETISQYVEGLIEKGLDTNKGDYVTVAEALTILDSLLKNATGKVIYSYIQCNMSGEIERLGLAKDILDLVADDAQALAMGPTGPQPKGFWDWLISVLLFVVTIIILAALSPFLLLGLLVAALIYIGITLIGPLLAAAALLLLKVIILVAIFIVLALVLLILAIFILAAEGFFILISAFKGGTVSYAGNSVNYNLQGKVGYVGFEIRWAYWDFMGMDVPYVKLLVTIDDNEILSMNFGIITESNELKDPPSENISDPDHEFSLLDFFGAAALVIGIMSSLIFLWVPLSWSSQGPLIIFSIGTLIFSAAVSLYFLFTQLETGSSFLGSAAAFAIVILLLAFAMIRNLPALFGLSAVQWIWIDAVISLILGILTLYDILFEIPPVAEAILTYSSFAISIVLLIAACIAAVIATNPTEPNRFSGLLILLGYCIFGGLLCLLLGLLVLT